MNNRFKEMGAADGATLLGGRVFGAIVILILVWTALQLFS